MKWKTIEKDGMPPVGTLCLCKLNEGSIRYNVLEVGSVVGKRIFQLYDLAVRDSKIIKYIPIQEIEED